MTNRISRRAIACALLATTCLSAPALAQNAGSETQPLQKQELDENGVNPATGSQISYTTDVSIGPDGPGGLRLIRGRGHGMNQSSYSYTLTGNPSVQLLVSAGLRSITFNNIGGSFVAQDGGGAKLVQNSTSQWTLTLEDGTVIVYKTVGINDSYKARGTDITYPTGEKITATYKTINYCAVMADRCTLTGHLVRQQSVASSLGFQLHFDYAANAIDFPDQANDWVRLVDIKAINTTIDPCDPLAGTCTTTQPWPTVSYNGTGSFIDPSTVTDPAGNIWTYADSTTQFKLRRPSSATDNVLVNVNSSTQRITSIVHDGMTWSYSFTPGTGTMTMVRTDPLGHTKTVVSDTNVGLPSSITDELGHATARIYNASKQLTQVTLPEGNNTQYSYDARGNVTQVKRVAKSGSGLPDIVSSAAYPSSCSNAATCNEPTSSADARGFVTDYAYNINGTLQSVTPPAPVTGGVRPQARYTYTSITTPGGTVVSKLQSVSQCQTTASCTGAADETKATYAWSNQLLLTGLTRANGTGTLSAVTTFTNDNVGNTKTIDGPLAGTADTTTLRYDLMRRLVGASSPDPDGAGPLKMRAVRRTYNADGNLSKVERGTVNSASDADWAAMSVLETTNVGYDSAARPVTVSLAGSDGVTQTLTQTSYDGEGRPQCSAVRMNQATFTTLPTDACTLGTAGSFGSDRVTKLIYDNADQVTQVQVAVGTADAATERTVTYSNNGLVTSLLDGENNLTAFVFDGHDRPFKTYFPNRNKGSQDINGSDFEQLTYENTASNTRTSETVASRRLRDGTSIAFGHDNLGRLTLKDLPGSEPDVSYGYDNLNRLTSATQSGNALSFGWDALGRKTSEAGPQGSTGFAYDLADEKTGITYSTSGGGSPLTVDYAYLTTGELQTISQGGTSLASYGYDNLGNRMGVTFGNGASQAFTYDAASRLQSLSNDLSGTVNDLSATFAYNPDAQIVSATRVGDPYAWTGHGSGSTATVSNGLNQQVTIGGSSASWDSKGNLTAEPQSGRTYGYSSENLLTSASGGVSLGYDPAMRLFQVAGAATTRFAYDGLDAIAEYNGAGQLQGRYAFDPTSGQPVVWYQGNGVTSADRRYLSGDERGSVISVSDSGGALMGALPNSYDEYGKPQSTNFGRFQYTGQMWVPEAGLYNYKARVYLPHLGIFAQLDPIGYGDGPNLYGYVGSDPVNYIDPTGTEDLWISRYACVAGNCGWTGYWAWRPDRVDRRDSSTSRSERDVGGGDNSGKSNSPQCTASKIGVLGHINAFLLGADDAVSFGLWSKVNDWIFGSGSSGQLQQSPMYTSGELGVAVASAGRLSYAGIARSFSSLPAAEAVAARNSLKGAMSGYGSAHPRAMSYQQALTKYGSNEAVAQAASRTNPKLNAMAAAGASSAVAAERQRCR